MCNIGMIFFASSHRNPKNLVEKELTHLKKKDGVFKSLFSYISKYCTLVA